MKKSCSLYIHIPFCSSKCAYCDFYSISCKKISDSYINLLLNELKYRKNQFNVDTFSTVYIGGGTPSLLEKHQLEKLLKYIVIQCENDAEITIEANPEHISKEFLETIIQCGVNRLSVGIQSLSDNALKFVSRHANKKNIINAIALINQYWLNINKNRLSLDLISGLPYCSNNEFIETVNYVTASGADHISLYSLTLEKETPLYKEQGNYNEEVNTEQWFIGKELLEKSGFNQYEVSNFCKLGCESRHNLTYWRKNDYIGIGSGATGTVNNYRYTNGALDSAQKYTLSEVVEKLDQKTLEFEYLMMGFRTIKGIDENDFYSRFGHTLESRIGSVFSQWQNKKLAQKNDSWWTLGKQGIMLLNEFLVEI